ncbi:MAG: type II toxin-antitoxin system VapC family toxin [Anaerolineae bacterium]|nr:type II toxin-antitoxin system VapC family toxin [Anaerolineae bacterium]
MPWAEFVERTAGILVDDPIERPPQPPAELYFGAMKSRSPQTSLLKQQAFVERFVSLPFDDAAAVVYGRIRAELERAGTPIGPNDLMIASIALANGLILVTHNVREFERVAGLQIDDWESGGG